MRKSWQGVGNIVRFNWHFYALALGGGLLLGLLHGYLPEPLRGLAAGALGLLAGTTLVSLGVSWYVYDHSALYRLDWLPRLAGRARVVNIHAGFDETSALVQRKLPEAALTVLDFYDPAHHTEVSIRRARRAYPPYLQTQAVAPAALPLASRSTDLVLAMLAAHEIRDEAERVAFFRELGRILAPGGALAVVEHLRDPANFLAYTVGFLHFHSRPTWLRTFRQAGFSIASEAKLTPFVTVFILRPNGVSA